MHELPSWLPLLAISLAAGLIILGVTKRYRRRDTEIENLYEHQLQESRRSLKDRDARLATHEQELQRLRAEQLSTRRNLANAELDMGKARQRLAELEPLLARVHDSESRLGLLSADLESARSAHATEIGDLRRKLTDADALRSQLAQSQQQLRTLDERLATVQRDKDQALASFSTRIAKLAQSAPLAELAPQLQARTRRVRELENDLARLRQRIVQLESLHGEVQARDAQIADLKLQLESLGDHRSGIVLGAASQPLTGSADELTLV